MSNSRNRLVPLALLVAASLGSAAAARAQSTTPGPKVHTNTGVPVHVIVNEESKESDSLEKLTASSFGTVSDTNCQSIIDIYNQKLLPAAEQAKFPNNKANYLRIAHKAIGDCQMTQGRYIEAEQSYREALAQAKIWPGIDDQRYANILNWLSAAQFKQDHWKDAEATTIEEAAFHQRRIDDYSQVMAKQTGEVAENIRKAKEDELSVNGP